MFKNSEERNTENRTLCKSVSDYSEGVMNGFNEPKSLREDFRKHPVIHRVVENDPEERERKVFSDSPDPMKKIPVWCCVCIKYARTGASFVAMFSIPYFLFYAEECCSESDNG